MTRTTWMTAAVAALATAALAAPRADAHVIIGIPPDAMHIVKFNGHSPALVSEVAVVGLATGERLAGLDYRVSTNQLYAVGTRGHVYAIDITTGRAFAISPTPIAPALATVEIDFDPVHDKLYVATPAGAMMRVDPDTGVVEARRTLRYAPAEAAGGALELGGIGFDDNYAGAARAALFGVDARRRTLVSIDDAGLVHTVGSLQLGKGRLLGFDIGAKPNADLAFSPMIFPGETTTKMYVIKRSTGATTFAGAVGGNHLLTHTTMVPDSFRVYAIDAGSGALISFVSSTPGAIESSKPLAGLDPGDAVVGLRYRPATGELYGLGREGRLYRIKPAAALAAPVGPRFELRGERFEFAFDRTGRARVVSDAMAGLSLDPDGGPAQAGAEGAIDPPSSSEVGYTAVQPPGGAGSMLYAVLGDRLRAPLGVVGGDQPRAVRAMAVMGRVVSFDAVSYKGDRAAASGKGLGGIPVSVNLSAPAAVAVTVDYATADDTAVAGTDYHEAHGTLTFQPGDTSRTLLLRPIERAVDGPRKLRLRLSRVTGPAMLGAAGPLFSNVVAADPEVEVTLTSKAVAAAPVQPAVVAAAPYDARRLTLLLAVVIAVAGLVTILVVRRARAGSQATESP